FELLKKKTATALQPRISPRVIGISPFSASVGAPVRTRPSTMLPPPDFESGASTTSATGACARSYWRGAGGQLPHTIAAVAWLYGPRIGWNNADRMRAFRNLERRPVSVRPRESGDPKPQSEAEARGPSISRLRGNERAEIVLKSSGMHLGVRRAGMSEVTISMIRARPV